MIGVEMIAAERQRQIEKEGYTLEHDANHVDGELAFLACYYAMPCMMLRPEGKEVYVIRPDEFKDETGWNIPDRHQHDRNRQLAIAGALIAAELDRRLAEASHA